MKLDTAAATFRRIDGLFTVQSTGELGKYAVLEACETNEPPVIHGEDMRHDDALALRDQLAGRDAVTAVLREMISPDTLSKASFKAGCEMRKFENNKLNQGNKPSLALLKGIIAVLEEDAVG